MAQFFEDEKNYPDNARRKNFVFFAYPFTPPISQDDYNTVVKELQAELSLRLWYFLDEVTTQELTRKIWRAILRADLCIFDTTGGNPNVAFDPQRMVRPLQRRAESQPMTALATS